MKSNYRSTNNEVTGYLPAASQGPPCGSTGGAGGPHRPNCGSAGSCCGCSSSAETGKDLINYLIKSFFISEHLPEGPHEPDWSAAGSAKKLNRKIN